MLELYSLSDKTSNMNMFVLSDTDKFVGLFPAQHLRAGGAAAILKTLLEDPT